MDRKRRWPHRLTLMLGAAIGLYLALCIGLFFAQRLFIYVPQARSPDIPVTLLNLPVDGANVVISTRPLPGPDALIYFGGNAEDVTRNLPEFSKAFPDHALYLMNYRGFGGSGGSPSEAALQRDAQALFDRVSSEHGRIVVIGRSLGSGVAVQLASERPATQLVLITPYDSLREIAEHRMPWFPVRWMLHDRFESWQFAQRVRTPTLLLAAADDTLIPLPSTQSLFSHFPPGVAKLQVIDHVGHNSISQSADYWRALEVFLQGK
ncbi:alpha/beta hydrolase [Pseudomonas sp. nanlin1]|uniref:alpha/beta hydrolase n=1 Tax=Pseudomonas sp. nanlin1 TaxID=3040605 RepID=UPI00388FFC08